MSGCQRSRRTSRPLHGGPGITEVVERRMWMDAPPDTVFEAFADRARLAGRQSGALDAGLEHLTGGDFRVELGDDKVVVGNYIAAVRPKRLVFTWAVASRTGTSVVTTVEVTLAPQGLGTSVHLAHTIGDRLPVRIGGNMSNTLTLYDRHGSAGDDRRCEWCGRAGEPLPFHVRSPSGDVEFAEPVLCAVCQGPLGYLHPHGGHPGVKEATATGDSEPRTSRPPTRKEREERRRQAAEWSSSLVSRLLTERFLGEGRPRPAWAGPAWVWPPRRPDAPEHAD